MPLRIRQLPAKSRHRHHPQRTTTWQIWFEVQESAILLISFLVDDCWSRPGGPGVWRAHLNIYELADPQNGRVSAVGTRRSAY